MRRDLTKFWLFDKVLVVHQIVKGKKGLNVKFEVDEKKEKQKERAPPNSVARIRSNLNLEVLFEVKKAKNAKSPKISQSFFCIFLQKLLVRTTPKFVQLITSILSTNVLL